MTTLLSSLPLRLLACAACFALLGFSCTGNSSTGPTDDETPRSDNFEVVAKDVQSVIIRFPARNRPTRQAYRVSYRALEPSYSGLDSGSFVVGDFENRTELVTAEVDGLEPQIYEFTISIVTTDYRTLPSFGKSYGAPATRHSLDPLRYGEPLRLYERNSAMGNGLIISPEFDGPFVTSINDAPDSSLAFVLIVTPHPLNESAIDTDLALAGMVMANVPNAKIAFSTVLGLTTELSTSDDPLDHYAVPYAFFTSFSPQPSNNSVHLESQTDPAGTRHKVKGFFCRIGNASDEMYRFVRVVALVDSNGRFLQGTAPNRYIEIELSIGHPGVPFA